MQANVFDRQAVKFIAIMAEVNVITTKNKQLMAITQVEDLDGGAKMLLFPRDYDRLRDRLEEDKVYKITGTLSIRADEPPCIFCSNLEPVEEVIVKRVTLKCDNPLEAQAIMKDIQRDDMLKGNEPMYIICDGIRVLLKRNYWVNANTFIMKYPASEVAEW
jgi:DNA polymerase-3 subunit alpha